MSLNLGYACINMNLSEKGISTNRGMIKKTFLTKGKDYAADLALKNLEDLKTIIKWNSENGIFIYRMSSCLFPWMSEYDFKDLYNYDAILKSCKEIGKLASDHGQRLSFHPGHFDILATSNPDVLRRTVLDLNQHAQIMDMMELREDGYNTINIHVGGAYGDKASALKRFCENFGLLQLSARKRLTVENDDKASMYSVNDLYNGVYKEIKIPIIFDFHHHRMCDGGLTERAALQLAASTWPSGIRPLTHYSSSKKLNEDSSVNHQAHAEYLYEQINTYGVNIDIELEAKAKELALAKYRKDYE
jgi:UV DNA damage endonuclease